MIENIWGLQRATNIIESYSTLSEIIILLLVVLIPVLCSLLIYKLFIYIRKITQPNYLISRSQAK